VPCVRLDVTGRWAKNARKALSRKALAYRQSTGLCRDRTLRLFSFARARSAC
jgi:hypothetical protein